MHIIKAKLGQAKSSITCAAAFAESIKDTYSLSLLQQRLEKLNESWSEFMKLNDELFNYCDDENYVDPVGEIAEYEDKYFEAHSLITDTIQKKNLLNPLTETIAEKLASQQATFLETINNSTRPSTVNLPKVNIPIFSGDYKDWPAFKDLFTGSIESNTLLTGSQKLQYLKSYLRGDAANLLKHLICSDSNYIEAGDKLEARYVKTHLIVQSFIHSYLSLPSSHSANVQILRKIVDGADEVIRGLNALQSNGRDSWLIYLLVQKVDQDTKQAWLEHIRGREDVTIIELIEFLDNRCSCLESCSTFVRASQNRTKSINSIRAHLAESKQKCPKCDNNHILSQCTSFATHDISSRRQFVKQNSLCFNCLRPSHNASQCRSNFRCRSCNGRHHSLVHPTHAAAVETASSNAIDVKNNSFALNPARVNSNSSSNLSVVSNHSLEGSHLTQMCILPTAVAKVRDTQGSYKQIRLLLDTSSQVSFITERLVPCLGLTRKRSRIPITGIASTSAGVTNGLVTLQIQSCYNSNIVSIDCHIVSKLTSLLPISHINNINRTKLWSIQLADPRFNIPGPIDILVGSDKVFSIITGPALPGENGTPASIPTIFGVVFAGQVNSNTQNTRNKLQAFCGQVVCSHGLDLERFWQIEEVSYQSVLSFEEQQAEDNFVSTHSRHTDGKFIVELPFKENIVPNFKNSFTITLNRLQSMERRFALDPEFKTQYSCFINEYISLGLMEEIPVNELIVADSLCCCLSHHAIFKTDSSTTKIRVVFDGSAKTLSTNSLNECLLVGPTIQRDLFSTSLRFRRFAYTLSGDIEKMYRQIWVSPKHTNFQRILWRENTDSPLKHFRLVTVTYGTLSAPFSAVRSLRQLALDSIETHPLASKIVLEDFYVDDLPTGADTIEELKAIHTEVVDLLKSAGFNLQKWTTNCWPLLLSLPPDQREILPIEFEESNSVKILGLIWCPAKDSFSFKVRLESTPATSKRRILSEASRIFDPIGFLAPVIVYVKIIMQDLWKEKLGWDQQIPENQSYRWNAVHQELNQLESLKIPRTIWSNKENWKFHAFCDASLDAYAAVVYCRSINNDK